VTNGGIVATIVWDDATLESVVTSDGFLEQLGSGDLRFYQSYGKRLAEKTAPFSQNAIPLKDLGLFKKTAQQVESPTPIARLLDDLLRSDEARA
jgi:3-hydroxyisobutyrate dehydrogenase-like beta-hydroxyacid dehydrogenase